MIKPGCYVINYLSFLDLANSLEINLKAQGMNNRLNKVWHMALLCPFCAHGKTIIIGYWMRLRFRTSQVVTNMCPLKLGFEATFNTCLCSMSL